MSERSERRYIQHLPTYGVIVCKQCQHAVWPQHMRKHLDSSHKQLSKREKEEIIQVIEGLDNLRKQETFEVPVQVVQRIGELVTKQGFQWQAQQNCH